MSVIRAIIDFYSQCVFGNNDSCIAGVWESGLISHRQFVLVEIECERVRADVMMYQCMSSSVQ
jgi:hypothetical protein